MKISGRKLFAIGKPLLLGLSCGIRTLPPPIRRFLLVTSRGIKGKIGIAIRYVVLKSLAQSLGNNVSIHENVIIRKPELLSIGNNVSIWPNAYLDCGGGIAIGDDVSIATGLVMISTSHTWGQPEVPIKRNPIITTPINIGDDVWIGCCAKIIGQCNIKERCIIAAGAVVKGDCQSHSIYGGVPAKKIKSI